MRLEAILGASGESPLTCVNAYPQGSNRQFANLLSGGYGHSRLREWVLGGVTRALLEHMTVPVLFSH